MVNVVEPPRISSDTKIVRTGVLAFTLVKRRGSEVRTYEAEAGAGTGQKCDHSIRVRHSYRIAVKPGLACGGPYFDLAYICITSAGMDTLIAVTAILSLSVRSSSFLREPLRVFRYIGMEVMAATPLILSDAVVRPSRECSPAVKPSRARSAAA